LFAFVLILNVQEKYRSKDRYYVDASMNGNAPDSLTSFINNQTAPPQSSLNSGGVICDAVELGTVTSNVLINENYVEVSL